MSFQSIAGGTGPESDRIWLKPDFTIEHPDQWEVYLPPTRPAHFDGYPGDFVFHEIWSNEERAAFLAEASIVGPYETSTWPSLETAIDFIKHCRDENYVSTNEGRILK